MTARAMRSRLKRRWRQWVLAARSDGWVRDRQPPRRLVGWVRTARLTLVLRRKNRNRKGVCQTRTSTLPDFGKPGIQNPKPVAMHLPSSASSQMVTVLLVTLPAERLQVDKRAHAQCRLATEWLEHGEVATEGKA